MAVHHIHHNEKDKLEIDSSSDAHVVYQFAIPSREKLCAVMKYVLDPNEFLSPYGVRSLSFHHQEVNVVCCLFVCCFRIVLSIVVFLVF
jgi:hypothetical protein